MNTLQDFLRVHAEGGTIEGAQKNPGPGKVRMQITPGIQFFFFENIGRQRLVAEGQDMLLQRWQSSP